jgi:glycosyltransferase involved in cell wall biosynthesis
MLVGRDPAAELRALPAADLSIEVTGRVPAIEAVLARAAVIASPLRHGTGMKNKVLEGAALGKAMVVTPVSLEDINLKPGRDLLLAGTPEAFADEIVSLLNDVEKRKALGAAARRTVEAKYAWEAMAERLWACYLELAKGGWQGPQSRQSIK